jgi:murein DD-endopeptidase
VGEVKMTGVSKRFFIGLAIFAVAALLYLGTVQLKAEANVEWRHEVTKVSEL